MVIDKTSIEMNKVEHPRKSLHPFISQLVSINLEDINLAFKRCSLWMRLELKPEKLA